MYAKLPIGTDKPGLIILLIDQSGSMSSEYGPNDTKMNFAALAVNRCVYEIVRGCQQGTIFKKRCQIGIYGYSTIYKDGTEMLSGGWVSEFEEQSHDINKVPRHIIRKKVPDGAGGLVDDTIE